MTTSVWETFANFKLDFNDEKSRIIKHIRIIPDGFLSNTKIEITDEKTNTHIRIRPGGFLSTNQTWYDSAVVCWHLTVVSALENQRE